jgi:hypothetical protein
LLSKQELKLAGLVERELITPLAERDKKRWIFVTQEIDDLLSGKQNPAAMFPCIKADMTFGRICRGYIVSLTRRKADTSADFKCLEGLDEAWSVKLPGPGSGWRMFGRFARKNVFVGLACHPRDDCAPWAVYNQRALDMIADWNSRWAGDPLRSLHFGDYVSDPFHDRDT